MSSDLEYVKFVAEQLESTGEITYKKMFGEYGFYCNQKFFGTVENNQLYIKITEAGQKILENPTIASPHHGAKYFLIDNLDDKEFLKYLVQNTCIELSKTKK